MTWAALGDLSTGVVFGAVLGLVRAWGRPRLRWIGLWMVVGWAGVAGLVLSMYVRGIV